MSIEKYKIRDKAQKPTRVQLFDPATDTQTEDWIEVRSSLSDEFMEARDQAMQEAQSVSEQNPEKRKELIREIQLRMKASLVAGWSFDVPFTQEEVVAFLREAPQIQQMVMSVADDSARFFSKPSAGSETGRKKK